jgi:hypothetical protein
LQGFIGGALMRPIESSEGVVCRVCEVLETPECNILSEFIIVFWSLNFSQQDILLKINFFK